MSKENTTATANPPMPPEAPKTGGNYRFVTVSDGEMKYKATRDATEKTVIEKVEGYFKRVGIQSSTIGKQTILSLEVEVEDREGVVNQIQVNLENSVGTGMMAGSVLEFAANDFVSIAANRSAEKNEYGHYTTFINCQRFNYNTQKWEEVRIKKADYGDGSWKELQDDLLTKVEKHPAYKLREKGDNDDDDAGDAGGPSSFEVYAQQIESKKWPSPRDKDNHPAHLAWLSELAGLDSPFGSFDDITDAQWKEINQAVGPAPASKIPAPLRALA